MSEPTRPEAGLSVLRSFLRDKPASLAVLIAVSFASGLLESLILLLIAQIAAALVNGQSHVAFDVGPANLEGSMSLFLLIAFGAAAIRLAIQVLAAYLPARLAADFEARPRSSLLAGYLETSWRTQAEQRDGHLQELTTNQVTQATDGVIQAVATVSSCLAFLVLVVSALFLSVVVAGIVLVVAALLSLLIRPINRIGSRHSLELSQAELDYAAGMSEVVRLSEETQVFGTAEEQRQSTEILVRRTRSLFFSTRFLGNLMLGAYQGLVILIIIGGLAALYWADAGRVATLSAVVLMLVRSAMYAQQTQGSYHWVLQAAPYRDRIQAAEATFRADADRYGSRRLPRLETLAFDRVGYSYATEHDARSDTAALSGVSFAVAAGHAVGIIGPSGAGKSTVVQVLLRLRAPTSGAFLVNGQPAAEYLPGEWRARVAYVPQEPRLLHASVAENIRFFRRIDDEAVIRAARLAHIHDDIVEWAEGYDTVIGQRAAAVSGGQRQRICLARALVGRPDILVLDEPTSTLDLRSEALVQESLAQLHGQLTLFVVAHRLTTLSTCDRILVLDHGRLEAFGPTAEIENTNAFYQAASSLTVGGGEPTSAP